MSINTNKIFSALMILLAVVILLLTSCGREIEQNVTVVESGSYFDGFEVKGGEVIFNCRLTLRNTHDRTVKFYIRARSDEDAGKLLEDGALKVVGGDGEETAFTLPPLTEEKQRAVTFTGKFGGVEQKQNRLLPEIEIVPAE